LFSEEQKQVKKKKTRGQILFLFFCRICHFWKIPSSMNWVTSPLRNHSKV
jgi:hypothetical protein